MAIKPLFKVIIRKMKRKRAFFRSSSFSVLVILLTIIELSIEMQVGSSLVESISNSENKITLTDIDDLELDPRQLLFGGANNTLALLGLLALAGLTLAGLAGVAYLLWTRGDGGGDNHYYYGSHSGGGYDHIDHADHGDYEEYDDYYRSRKRRSTKFDEQVACKLR